MHTVNVFKHVLPSECCCHWRSPIPATSRQQSRCVSDVHIPRVAAWDHRTLPLLARKCMHMVNIHSDAFAIRFLLPSVLCTQVNVHWDGIAIRNHLLPFHQFYAHKLMSTEMALQSKIIWCYLISFMHTSESPPRWRCNHKLSVAISSVLCNFISFSSPLCTQVNVHWYSVAIKDHQSLPHLTSEVFCTQWMSPEMLSLSNITNHSHVPEYQQSIFCFPQSTLKTALALEFTNCCHLTPTTHPAECM